MLWTQRAVAEQAKEKIEADIKELVYLPASKLPPGRQIPQKTVHEEWESVVRCVTYFEHKGESLADMPRGVLTETDPESCWPYDEKIKILTALRFIHWYFHERSKGGGMGSEDMQQP